MAKPLLDSFDAIALTGWRTRSDLRPGVSLSEAWPSGRRGTVDLVGGPLADGRAAAAWVTLRTPEGDERRHLVAFARVRLSYGPQIWLRCPRCDARTGRLLIVADDALGCRQCIGAVYPSQRERDLERSVRRLRAASQRAGGDGAALLAPPRPRGRWRTTHLRQIAALETARLRLAETLFRT